MDAQVRERRKDLLCASSRIAEIREGQHRLDVVNAATVLALIRLERFLSEGIHSFPHSHFLGFLLRADGRRG